MLTNFFQPGLFCLSFFFSLLLSLIRRDYHEDMVSPDDELIYRVSPYYLIGTKDIQIQFDGIDSGTVVVCMARNRNFQDADCQTVAGYAKISFYLFDACDTGNDCRAVYFRIAVERSLVKCLGLFPPASPIIECTQRKSFMKLLNIFF